MSTVLTDAYKSVTFNVGQEARAADFNDAQRFLSARLSDQMFAGLLGTMSSGDIDPDVQTFQDPRLSPWALVVAAGAAMPQQGGAPAQVLIGQGTAYQFVAVPDGSDSQLLAFTFDGVTSFVTLANGDGSHPRVDLIQMKLEYVATDLQSRVFAQPSVKADVHMGSVTTHFDTVLRAKAGGRGGESISVRTVAGGAAAYSESGYQCTFTYVDGVTTVAVLQALPAFTSSNLIEIETSGTGANVLHAPADTVGYTFMTGGEDQVLTSQAFDMKRAVQCTLSVKSGTPAASPQYPTLDAGCCAIAAVVVPTAFAWGTGLVFADDVAHPTLHDQRLPLGIRKYVVNAANGVYDTNAWIYDPATPGHRQALKTVAGVTELLAFQFNRDDDVESSGVVGGHTPGQGGVTQPLGQIDYYRVPTLASCDSGHTRFLTQVTIYADDSTGGSSFSLMKFDETTLTYTAVAGASIIGITLGVAVLIPTTPISFGSGEVLVVKCVSGTNACVIKKGEYLTSTFPNNGVGLGGTPHDQLLVPCPVSQGRLIGVAVSGTGVAGATGLISGYAEAGALNLTTLATISPLVSTGAQACKIATRDYLESHAASNAIQSSQLGPPAWCNGLRSTIAEFASSGNSVEAHQLVAQLGPGAGSQVVRSVIFYVAEGL